MVDFLGSSALLDYVATDPITFVIILAVTYLSIRVIHRIYYLFDGHVHLTSYHPRQEMLLFLKKKDILMTEHSFICKRDKVCLRYRKIGTGPKMVLLNNGVGTDFYMWLPTLTGMVNSNPNLFEEITLIAPSYRGLFGCDITLTKPENSDKEFNADDESFYAYEDGTPNVTVTMSIVALDSIEIMEHLKVAKYHTIIGWSLGAQSALSLCAARPSVTENLFLLNPSTGTTLHYAFQSVFPFPLFIRKIVSNGIKSAIILLLPLIKTGIWDTLKKVVFSSFFRIVLEGVAFLGGCPPEQPTFFHSYMKDVFHTRNQTAGLLYLIAALDDPVDDSAFTIPNNTVIVSGFSDVLTGVLHSWRLSRSLPRNKHVTFSLASHFLLLEWPNLLALEILKVVNLPSIQSTLSDQISPKLTK